MKMLHIPNLLNVLKEREIPKAVYKKASKAIQWVFPSWLGYHHVLVILFLLPSLICHCLLLAGSFSSLTSIYVISLCYEDVAESLAVITVPSESTGLEVRAGYFGIAARSSNLPWKHAPSDGSLPMRYHDVQDPYSIVATGSQFKNDVLFPGLIILVDVLCLLSAIGLLNFPNWIDERDRITGSEINVKPFPSRPVSRAIAACLGFASALAFGSAVWQHTSAASVACLAETLSQSQIHVRIGTTAVALVWAPVLLIALAFIRLAQEILSIFILDKLTDND
ncbi:Ca2+ regulator and membrane fusion protein Fig1-domain-containing protein [Lophiotrema nucula]|uniref:Ca2+ regulator and membrane fusion protein Fig1-domain-containing protein n=1 Tax=Lophiotrema nucula TaxID=690887 RepID=A0A6A5ZM65_9PLEO|nr:Ca2+ regulator and membrane fusion protein Fig1-domain-containing protein [Lophiotrema nucula]